MAPRLSVIVPIYNVEHYLSACLDSLESQTFADIEVIMVDDGSPDSSADIAATYEARDSRFTLVRKENAGLGAARNTGIEHVSATSEYLTFVDSDDLIPRDAYRLMVASLDETRSDFATGNVFHLKGERTWQVPLLKMLAGAARRRTHIERYPKLVADRIACNKVFRRTFWEKHDFFFPEGVLHEDIPVVLPAHYLAEAVDVIGEAVYFWRQREGEAAPSITQRRTEIKAIQDRVSAVENVSRFLASRPGKRFAELKRAYDDRVLRDDLRIFLNVLPDADTEYHDAFLDATNRYLAQVDPQVAMELPVALRVQWLLVRKRAMNELIDLLAAQRRGEPVKVNGLLRKYAEIRPLDESDLRLPRKALRIDKELQLRVPLRGVEWRDGKLFLAGDAWIEKTDLPSRRSSFKMVQLKKDGSRRRLVLPVKNVYRPECTTDSGQKLHNFDWAGWEFALDPARLRRGAEWEEGTWHVGMRVVSSGLMRKRALQSSGGGSVNYPPYHWLNEDFRLLPRIESGAFKLRVEKVRALITDRRSMGDVLEVEGEVREPLAGDETLEMAVTNWKSGEVFRYAADRDDSGERTRFSVQVPFRDITLVTGGIEDKTQPERRDWSTVLVATDPKGAERRFSTVVADGVSDARYELPVGLTENGAHLEIAVLAGHNGYLKFSGRPTRAVITSLTETTAGIALTGRTDPRLVGSEFFLKARNRFEERVIPVRWSEDGTFQAEFDPSTLGNAAGTIPLKAGRWNFHLRSQDSDEPPVMFAIDRLASSSFPLKVEFGGRRYWVESRWGDFPQLNCRSALSDLERGPYRLLQMRREVYEPSREKPLRDQVLYLSYNGKQYSDSPRAMHEDRANSMTDRVTARVCSGCTPGSPRSSAGSRRLRQNRLCGPESHTRLPRPQRIAEVIFRAQSNFQEKAVISWSLRTRSRSPYDLTF